MRVAAAADFGNGVSAVVDWNTGWLFINPDLTDLPAAATRSGEWVALDAVTLPVGPTASASPRRRSTTSSGRIGRSVQSLLFDRLRRAERPGEPGLTR